MKRVYVGTDPVHCGWLESILLDARIPCLVRNRFLGGAIGELPINESWPEIWVLDDRDAAAAERLLARAEAPILGGDETWRCAGCGEIVEAQFGQCWNCGAHRPAATQRP